MGSSSGDNERAIVQVGYLSDVSLSKADGLAILVYNPSKNLSPEPLKPKPHGSQRNVEAGRTTNIIALWPLESQRMTYP